MKKLIIVRHGDYNNKDETLTSKGELDINSAAKKIQQITEGLKVLILSSPIQRARNTSKIISGIMNITFEEHDILDFSFETSNNEDNQKMFDLVQSREDTDILIIVTHMEQTAVFPGYFSDNKLGKYLDSPKLERGQACLIDCELVKIDRL